MSLYTLHTPITYTRHICSPSSELARRPHKTKVPSAGPLEGRCCERRQCSSGKGAGSCPGRLWSSDQH